MAFLLAMIALLLGCVPAAASAITVSDLGEGAPLSVNESRHVLLAANVFVKEGEEEVGGPWSIWADGAVTPLEPLNGGPETSEATFGEPEHSLFLYRLNAAGDVGGSSTISYFREGKEKTVRRAVWFSPSGVGHEVPVLQEEVFNDKGEGKPAGAVGTGIDGAGDVVGIGAIQDEGTLLARGFFSAGGTSHPSIVGGSDGPWVEIFSVNEPGTMFGAISELDEEGEPTKRKYALWKGPSASATVLDFTEQLLGFPLANDGSVLGGREGQIYLRTPDGKETAVAGLSKPFAVNSSHVVVGSKSVSGAEHAATWKGGTVTDLNSLLPKGSSWVLQRATAIDDKGDIAGLGTHEGKPRAFLIQTEAGLTASISGEPSVALPQEGTAKENFTVSLSAESSEPVTVKYRTEDGTATVANDDYTEASGTLTFEPGETSKQIEIQIDDGDGNDDEASETYAVSLQDTATATVSPSAATATGTVGLPGLAGHTVETHGKGLGDVTLTLTGQPKAGAAIEKTITTAADGSYSLFVDAGEYKLTPKGVPEGQPEGLTWTPGVACPGKRTGASCEKIKLEPTNGKLASAKVDFAYGAQDPQSENIEVLQAVQQTKWDAAGAETTLPDGTKAPSFNYSGVRMGAGSQTIARLYASNNGAQTAETVNAQLRAFTGSGAAMTELPGGPIPALDSGLNLLAGPQTEAERPNATTTFNFVLPESWTTTDAPITLVGTVDPAKTFPECPKCQDNDSVALSGVSFTKEKPLTLKPVPLTFLDKGSTIAPLNAAATIEAIWPWFPLARSQIVVAAPTPAVDLSATLKTITTALRRAREPMPGDQQSLWGCLAYEPCNDELTTPLFMLEMEAVGAKFKTTAAVAGGIPVGIFHGGTLGGTLGETIPLDPRPLFATDEASGNRESLPHEILHSLGYSHTAGCGSPAAPEPYPVTPPNILGFGVDRSSKEQGGIGPILSGTGDPPYTDLMSYCRPRWQSSVNWNRLVERLATGTLPGPVSTLASTSSVRRHPGATETAHSAGASTVAVEAVVIDGKPVFDGVLPGVAFPGGGGSAYALQTTNAGGHVTRTTKMAAVQVEGDSTKPQPPIELLSALVPASSVGQLHIVHAGKTVAHMPLPAHIRLRLVGTHGACRRGGYVTLRYRSSAPALLTRARLSAGRGRHLKLVGVAGASGSIRVAAARLPKSDNRVSLSLTDGFSTATVTVPLRARC